MKILFSGGATGGHFYPIIAVAEAIHEKVRKEKLIAPEMYYMGPTQYNPRALFENDLIYVGVSAGKWRRYFSLLNISDIFKTISGIISAVIDLYQIYPDVVFGKGGYGSFPALVAARLLRIPVVIHESDSTPGRVNVWAAKFAQKIAVSYPEAGQYFIDVVLKGKKGAKEKIAFTGNPVRKEIRIPLSNGAHEFLDLETGIPTIFVMGGSQGSQTINDAIIDSLPQLLNDYQIIHQTGKANLKSVNAMAKIVLEKHPFAARYKTFDYLNDLAIRMSAGIAQVVISRAGSTIFEIAAWGVPSIIIPLSEKVSHDQTKNAFAYARSGACSVIEEHNLTNEILTYEVNRIVNDEEVKKKMREAALGFARLDSADLIAQAILDIALQHE